LKTVYDLKIINLFGMLYGFYGRVNTKTGINGGHQYEPSREICLGISSEENECYPQNQTPTAGKPVDRASFGHHAFFGTIRVTGQIGDPGKFPGSLL
jgi:hypothetical protein